MVVAINVTTPTDYKFILATEPMNDGTSFPSMISRMGFLFKLVNDTMHRQEIAICALVDFAKNFRVDRS